jgi:hypothetical protein
MGQLNRTAYELRRMALGVPDAYVGNIIQEFKTVGSAKSGNNVGQLLLQYGCTYAILAVTDQGTLLGSPTGRRFARNNLRDFKVLPDDPKMTLKIFVANAMPEEVIEAYTLLNKEAL